MGAFEGLRPFPRGNRPTKGRWPKDRDRNDTRDERQYRRALLSGVMTMLGFQLEVENLFLRRQLNPAFRNIR